VHTAEATATAGNGNSASSTVPTVTVIDGPTDGGSLRGGPDGSMLGATDAGAMDASAAPDAAPADAEAPAGDATPPAPPAPPTLIPGANAGAGGVSEGCASATRGRPRSLAVVIGIAICAALRLRRVARNSARR
jgi:hypothetical protein